ncbi:hypothetical protein KIN20_035601 [Parelaphostrongylus tenuis]|uniref:Uncharacterized protein n=1 Tax=Parelaphostrongylus tenuis TaxID=148309 RepID=A0AAD5RC01_PARTN|nr:hypothetical protein KIN20_035601 [Parelaphostrongylus tenuis]
MFIQCVVLLLVFQSVHLRAEDITALYLETSMELIAAMNGTGADEGELHQLAKDIVYYGEDQQRVQDRYDAYLVKYILERETERADTSSDDLLEALKVELAKVLVSRHNDIGMKKAESAVEMVIKQLRLVDKRHVGWFKKANKLFFSLIKHDEH